MQKMGLAILSICVCIAMINSDFDVDINVPCKRASNMSEDNRWFLRQDQAVEI